MADTHEALAARVVESVRRFIKRSLDPRDERIAKLEAAVAERDHQLERHREHLQRLETKMSAMQARCDRLEGK